MIEKSIFRAYDIRGIYPTELNERSAYVIGRAIAKYLDGTKTAAISRDARSMAPTIQRALMEGLRYEGVEVIDLGMISSDTRAFATGSLGYDLSVSVTASHNPKEWIGMKICGPAGADLGGANEIVEIGEIAAALDTDTGEYHLTAGEFATRDISEEWLGHVLAFMTVERMRPLKIVVDAGNGVAGPLVQRLADKLGLDIVPMYFEPDGEFPNHLPSPIEPENTADLRARVVAEGADLGMAFDGDADRVFLIDNQGNLVTGSEMTAMVIDATLARDPNQTVLYNAICGWNVRDVLAKYPQATAYRTKVGHGYIKKDMRKYQAVFAGEHSGHYFFRDNFYADSGLVAAVVALGLISTYEGTIAQMLGQYRQYVQIPETNFRVGDAKAVMERLAQEYANGKVDWLDGLTVEFEDWWFNVRPSSNEPLLRLNVEAKTVDRLSAVTSELSAKIKQLGQGAA